MGRSVHRCAGFSVIVNDDNVRYEIGDVQVMIRIRKKLKVTMNIRAFI